MEDLINSLKMAMQNENWYSALFLALSLPDICGNIDHPNCNVKYRYKAWFDEYMLNNYKKDIGSKNKTHIFFNGDDCYAFRCSLIHAGSDNITKNTAQRIHDKFRFSTTMPHLSDIINDKKLVLNVKTFCFEIQTAVTNWFEKSENISSVRFIKIHDANEMKI